MKRKSMKVVAFALCAILLSNTLVSYGEDLSHTFHEDTENRVWCHGEYSSDNMKIALTFDDGPCKGCTERILDLLEEENVKATFFLIGKNAEDNKAIMLKEFALGHEIGAHSYTHEHLHKKSSEEIKKEMIDCENAFVSIINLKPHLFRPPEGLFGEKLTEIAKEMNYDIIYWSVDTRDWENKSGNCIKENVFKNTKGGSIILFHDFAIGKEENITVLKEIIENLKRKGYEFATVSEIISERSRKSPIK